LMTMKTIDDLKLQAYLDGELSAADASNMERLLTHDAEAQELLGELRMTRDAIVANEPKAQLPESLDFHWSKIAREIERSEAASAHVPFFTRALGWLRYLAPATAAVAAVVVLVVVQIEPKQTGEEIYTESAPEVSPVVFQSQEENMTVIWLQGDVDPDFAAPEGD